MTTTTATEADPIHWSEAVRIPDGATPDTAGMAAYFSAQFLAHQRAFRAAIFAFSGSGEPGQEPDAARDALNAAVDTHLPVMGAAWVAASTLKGWKPADAWGVMVEGDETGVECCWEWMFDVLDVPSDEENAFYDRLTTELPTRPASAVDQPDLPLASR